MLYSFRTFTFFFFFLKACCFGFESELNYLKAFDDSIIYRLAWEKEDQILKDESLEIVPMMTAKKEKYMCSLPKMIESKKHELPPYDGPNSLQLLTPLFSQMSCSYRLESFWTYELCHGRYIRQYHEERDGKKVKLQEYYLGKWDKEKMDKQIAEIDAEIQSGERREVPVRKIEGLLLPYLLITMDSGTLCDLNGKPRSTRIYYVCYPAGKHEIFLLEESSTCEYEIVVLTPYLCQHPDYRAKESEENKIHCWAVEGSPKKPLGLVEIETESLLLQQHQNLLDSFGLADSKFKVEFRQVDDDTKGQKQTVAFITPSTGANARETNDKEAPSSVNKNPTNPAENLEEAQSNPSEATLRAQFLPSPQPVFDPELVKNFLSGEYCLDGGSGWWRYEFCYGKRVEQYHEEKDGTRNTILLGIFNEEKHLTWLEDNPSKRPKPGAGRKHVSNMYTDGSYCLLTGSPRRVEVKLKCKENALNQDHQHSMNAVSLYLLEPQPCAYVLGVEASFLCPLIEAADANGLIDLDMISTSESNQIVQEDS